MMCQNVCFFRLPEKKTSRPVSTKNKQKETMKSRTYWSGFKMTKCLQPLFMDIIILEEGLKGLCHGSPVHFL